MAWIRAPSEARARGMYRTTPSGHELVHSCAGHVRTRKIQSCRSRWKREGVVASHLFRWGLPPRILRHHSEERGFGSAEMVVAPMSFPRNVFRTVQESHLRRECGRCDFPANTECKVTHRTRLRTKMVLWWRKLNQLFFSNQHANRSSLESIFLAELVFEKAEVGGRDIVRVTDKQRKDRRLRRHLGHKGRFGDLRRFAFTYRQGVGGEDLLEELVQ